MEGINVDRVLVVRSDTLNNLRVEDIQIPSSDYLLDSLTEMSKDDNSTLLDICSEFLEWWKRQPIDNKERAFKYCLPYEYSESYISPVVMPKILTKDEYDKICREMMKDCIRAAEDTTPRYLSDRRESVKEKADYYYQNRMRKKKYELVCQCQRYILGINYYNTVKNFKEDSSIRMFSSEVMGWTTFEHKVSDDIIITMKTNLCYGRVAYLKLWIKYKGVDILPYSTLINYYKANMVDIIRYTRGYAPLRKNWEEAMKFVETTGNLSKNNPGAFIQEYIINDIEKMLLGLKEISSNPSSIIDKMRADQDKDQTQYLSVRNINEGESNEYLVHPYEMTLAFKAEKITGSLYYLDNLQKLNDKKIEVSQYISKIREINIAFLPELEEGITCITTDIGSLEASLEEKLTIFIPLKEKIDEYETKYQSYIEECTKNKVRRISTKEDFLSGLFKSYLKDKKNYDEVRECVSLLKQDLFKRKKYLELLSQCRTKIIDSVK